MNKGPLSLRQLIFLWVMLHLLNRWDKLPDWMQGLLHYILVVCVICLGPLTPALIVYLVLVCNGTIHIHLPL